MVVVPIVEVVEFAHADVAERDTPDENAAQSAVTIGLGVPGIVVILAENVVDTVVELIN